ncbi:MAG: hypothetical protein QOE27_2231 [Solirubrobacteraceae bacterium]|jgi:hypothetical protein|nr:hypothetical protein [Solirubrobacteraceae bacterium]
MRQMISAALRTVAVLASLVLLASFSLFAVDQAGGASQQAQAEVGSSGAQVLGPAIQGAGAEQGFRGTLDDVDRALVAPIHPFAPGPAGSWAERSVELAGGLLIYGLLLGVLARSAGLAWRRRNPTAARPRPEAHF